MEIVDLSLKLFKGRGYVLLGMGKWGCFLVFINVYIRG